MIEFSNLSLIQASLHLHVVAHIETSKLDCASRAVLTRARVRIRGRHELDRFIHKSEARVLLTFILTNSVAC